MKKNSFLAEPGKTIRLKDFDPAFKAGYASHQHAKAKLKQNVEQLAKYQDLLYADHNYSVLVVLQAMDAGGKDGTVKHVMSGVNPEGCVVTSFKQPSTEELAHDFLWRAYKALPARGVIGIFNRSYYEEVLVVRVHPGLLHQEHLHGLKRPNDKFWKHRFQSINDMERHLVRNGTLVLKFFLHVSRQEQARRLRERLDNPDKNWKFSEADLHERLRWEDYQQAYQEMINGTSTKLAPWYIIPADHKWFAHLTVSEIVIGELKKLNLHYPEVTDEQRKQLEQARDELNVD